MKRNYAKKASLVLLLIGNALFFTSCSSLWPHRGQVTDSVQKGESSLSGMVPKEQYDELAKKYQDLLNTSKNQMPKTDTTHLAASEIEGVHQTKPETSSVTSIDPSELVNSIDKAVPDIAAVDTVNMLKSESSDAHEKGPPVPTSIGVQQVNHTDDVDDQITKLREVQELVKVNKFDNALTLLKELENSKEKQIVVRAKLMLGDLLFNQNEYDLASQVYEEIIKKYAFSGQVLKALGKLVACSEKLKQPEKQAKYYSLLHDFFEAS